jgi:hypothetical protein
MALITSPLAYHKLHSQHVGSLCEFVCLPNFLFDEFVRKSGKGDDAYPFVQAWAETVKAAWQGRDITDDNLTFWRKRWSERAHPIKAAFLGADHDSAAVAQALDTRRRRAEMEVAGKGVAEIEAIFEAEWQARQAK